MTGVRETGAPFLQFSYRGGEEVYQPQLLSDRTDRIGHWGLGRMKQDEWEGKNGPGTGGLWVGDRVEALRLEEEKSLAAADRSEVGAAAGSPPHAVVSVRGQFVHEGTVLLDAGERAKEVVAILPSPERDLEFSPVDQEVVDANQGSGSFADGGESDVDGACLGRTLWTPLR